MAKVKYKKDGSLTKRQLSMLEQWGAIMLREGSRGWSTGCFFPMPEKDATVISRVLLEYAESHT